MLNQITDCENMGLSVQIIELLKKGFCLNNCLHFLFPMFEIKDRNYLNWIYDFLSCDEENHVISLIFF